MRIITGIYKGRHFDIPKSFKARPTTDFAKENIFNVLTGYMDFEDAMALDLFSGTGSISLELLSRGCKQVISVEADRDHHRFIQQCLQKLQHTGGVTPLRGDAFRFIKSCKELPTIPSLIFEHNLLKDDGIFVFEHGKDHDFSDDPHFVEHRSYGSVNFTIFRKEATTSV